MLTADFDYELPPERIAQTPLAERDQARLLVDAGPGRRPHHAVVRDLPALLAPGDVVVVNDTRVLPARVAVRRASGGAAEVLLLERVDGWWEALVRPSRKLKPGEVVHAGEDAAIEIGDDLGEGRRRVRFVASRDLADDLATLDLAGTVPLPPYITEPLDDDERYQTVYAHHPGSAAAPTAGLHLTEAVLEALRARQIRVETVDLQVGLGTFRPIATDAVDDHVMHRERYAVPVSTQAAIAARPPGARVVAVGTTTLRALEACGLVTLVEERPRRGLTERIVQATASSYVVSPAVLGPLAAEPDRADRLSARYLLALASRTMREVAALLAGATKANQPLATLAVDTDIRFASAADRSAFTDELAAAVRSIASKYHDEQAAGGRWHRLVVTAYPTPKEQPR